MVSALPLSTCSGQNNKFECKDYLLTGTKLQSLKGSLTRVLFSGLHRLKAIFYVKNPRTPKLELNFSIIELTPHKNYLLSKRLTTLP